MIAPAMPETVTRFDDLDELDAPAAPRKEPAPIAKFNVQFDYGMSQYERIRAMLEHDFVFLLVGDPGVGKSEMVWKAAAALGYFFIDVRVSQVEPVDMRGLPYQEKIFDERGAQIGVRVNWGQPDYIAQACYAAEEMGMIPCICYEELNTGSISVMNTTLQPLLTKQIGPHRLPESTRQCACVNPASAGAMVNPMGYPLVSRFMVMYVEPSLQELNQHMFANDWAEPVIAYLNYRPDAINQPKKKQKGGEFDVGPNPRAWARVSRQLKKGLADFHFLKMSVGEGAAREFIAFFEERSEMPDIDLLLAGKADFDFSAAKVSISYATVVALAQRVASTYEHEPTRPSKVAKSTEEKLEGAGRVLLRVKPEIAALYYNLILETELPDRVSALMSTPANREWFNKHRALVYRSRR